MQESSRRPTVSHHLSPRLSALARERGMAVLPISQDHCEAEHVKQSESLAHMECFIASVLPPPCFYPLSVLSNRESLAICDYLNLI